MYLFHILAIKFHSRLSFSLIQFFFFFVFVSSLYVHTEAVHLSLLLILICLWCEKVGKREREKQIEKSQAHLRLTLGETEFESKY